MSRKSSCGSAMVSSTMTTPYKNLKLPLLSWPAGMVRVRDLLWKSLPPPRAETGSDSDVDTRTVKSSVRSEWVVAEAKLTLTGTTSLECS